MINTTFYKAYDGQEAAELAFRDAVARPALSQFFKVLEGIKGKQSVYFIDPVEFVTILDEGCTDQSSQLTLNITGETWSPVDLIVWKWECWKDLRGKVFEWMLKPGNDKYDLSGTKYADYMLEAIQAGAYNDLVRMSWFADASMSSSVLTNPAELPYYKTFNGIWKRIFDAKATGKIAAAQYVSMSDVNSAAYQGTDGLELEPGYAAGVLRKVFKAQSRALKSLPLNQRQLLVTQSIYDNFLEGREDASLNGIELAYTIIGDGIKTLTFRGVPLQVVDEWDIRIAASFTKAGVSDLPHRIILTQFGNLQLGFDTQPQTSATDNPLEVFNDQTTRKWHARASYVADAQIANKGLMVVAY